jgi:hypothetical protein
LNNQLAHFHTYFHTLKREEKVVRHIVLLFIVVSRILSSIWLKAKKKIALAQPSLWFYLHGAAQGNKN